MISGSQYHTRWRLHAASNVMLYTACCAVCPGSSCRIGAAGLHAGSMPMTHAGCLGDREHPCNGNWACVKGH